jgi:hypothetical protein
MQYRRRSRSRRRRMHNALLYSSVYKAIPRAHRFSASQHARHTTSSKTLLRRRAPPARTQPIGTKTNLRRGSYTGKSPWQHGQAFWEVTRPIRKVMNTMDAISYTNKYLIQPDSHFGKWAQREIYRTVSPYFNSRQ